jgi:hypothetical protein
MQFLNKPQSSGMIHRFDAAALPKVMDAADSAQKTIRVSPDCHAAAYSGALSGGELCGLRCRSSLQVEPKISVQR